MKELVTTCQLIRLLMLDSQMGAEMDDSSLPTKGPILIIGGYRGRGAGGSGRVFLEEVAYLQKKGFKIHIIALQQMPPLEDIYSGAYKIEVEAIPKRFSSGSFLLQNIDRLRQILILRKRIKEIQPSVIICYTAFACAGPYLATLFSPFPYVTHIFQTIFWPVTEDESSEKYAKYAFIHRKVFDEIRESVPERKEFLPPPSKLGLRLRLKTELEAIARYLGVRKARKIFVFSEQMKWEVGKLYGKDAFVSKGAFTSSIPNYKPGKNIKQKLGLTDKRMILSVCTLVPKKRVDLLIKAFQCTSAKLGDVVLIIGGVGPEADNLKALAEKLRIADRVRFTGLIPEQELWDYYAACDVCVHLDCADFALSGYEPLALQKKVVWSSENEIDDTLARNRHVFITKPTIGEAASTIAEALNTEVTEKNDLSGYTWDTYFEGILREILPIMTEDRR